MEALLNEFIRRQMQREEPDIEDKKTLSRYYAPLLKPEQRTDEILRILAECFGDDSSICMDLPRPLFCLTCCEKYIKNIFKMIQYLEEINDNTKILEVLKDIILPRFEEIQEQLAMVMEHQRATREPMSTDIIFEFLGIDMTVYDPPSEKIMEKCNCQPYVKGNESNQESCVVCICDFEEGEQVKKLVCGHQFHDDCIMAWLKSNSTCPICKASLKDDEEEIEVEKEPYNLLQTINQTNQNDENDENNIPEILTDLKVHGVINIFVNQQGTLSYHTGCGDPVDNEIYVGTIYNSDSNEINIESESDEKACGCMDCDEKKCECDCHMPGLETLC